MNPVDDYLQELELLGRSHSALKQVRKVIKKFQESSNGNGFLQATEDNIKDFIRYMRDSNIKETSLIADLKTLERFYSYVVESQKYGLTVNPVTRLSQKFKVKRRQTKRPIKTVDEITNFIKNIHNPRDRAIVILLAKTAIRNGELVALDIEDIDFEDEILNINKHVADDSINLIAKSRKNGNETQIPLDDETIRALKFYLTSRPKFKDINVEDRNALFISYTGHRLYGVDVGRIVKEWSIKTGIGSSSKDTDKKIVPHFFRAWATYTLQINGCNPAVIDAIRGDTASTIRAFYVNQVLPFEVIRKEYLKAVPKFGI